MKKLILVGVFAAGVALSQTAYRNIPHQLRFAPQNAVVDAALSAKTSKVLVVSATDGHFEQWWDENVDPKLCMMIDDASGLVPLLDTVGYESSMSPKFLTRTPDAKDDYCVFSDGTTYYIVKTKDHVGKTVQMPISLTFEYLPYKNYLYPVFLSQYTPEGSLRPMVQGATSVHKFIMDNKQTKPFLVVLKSTSILVTPKQDVNTALNSLAGSRPSANPFGGRIMPARSIESASVKEKKPDGCLAWVQVTY